MLFLASLNLDAQKKADESGLGIIRNRAFFNLENFWDSSKVCANPNKGWELHYFDDGLTNYGSRLAKEDLLLDFPGLRNIYLRLAWAYLEPREGQFNWTVVDSVVNKWTKAGYNISFRITCKETHDLMYATPEWVRLAGSNGKIVQENKTPKPQWEPDYGDSIFLAKLDNFHRAFAERYDGKPWISFVDIGSIGEWGEGHTAYSGWYDVPVEVIKKHIGIYKKYYKKSTLVISDDFIAHRGADDGSDDELQDFIVQNNIGFRDDSFGVGWNINRGFGYSTITNPELYDLVWKKIPVVLESDHYRAAGKPEIWEAGKRMETAIKETHATYISFHHWPREWLKENYNLSIKLANLCGYWYFPKYAVLPDTLRKSSSSNYLKMTWENHGAAPGYLKYSLKLKLFNQNTGTAVYLNLDESNNLNWMPRCIVGEKYELNLSQNIIVGKYDILIGLFDESTGKLRKVDLALKNERKDNEGYFKMGEINVAK